MPRAAAVPAVRFAEAADTYLRIRQRKGLAASTVREDRYTLARFAKYVGGDPWMSQLSEAVVTEYFYGDGGRADELGPSTFNATRAHLSAFFYFCRQKGWVLTDPMTGIDNKRLADREWRRLSVTELTYMIDNARYPRDRIALAVAANTALRASEIFGLRLRDVDLDDGIIDAKIYKTRQEDKLPITKDLDAELRRWFEHYQSEFPGQPLPGDWRLVPGQYYQHWGSENGRKVTVGEVRLRPTLVPANQSRIVHRGLEALGWQDLKGEGFHTIRRSVARLFFDSQVAKGYDGALQATKALLHHKHASQTEHYIGVTNERRHRDVQLKGQPFLSAMLDSENVIPLRGVAHGSAHRRGV